MSTSSRTDFLNGLMLGFVVALYVCMIGYGYFWAIAWLEEWQTLVTGILATTAACTTVWAIGLQITQVDTQRSEALTRKNLAARAAIAQPLSNISEIQRNIHLELQKFLNQATTYPIWKQILSAKDVEQADIQFLVNCLESSEGISTADISEMISELQIQASRLRYLRVTQKSSHNLITRTEIVDYAVDAVFIYARTARLIYYARRQDELYTQRDMKQVLDENCNIMVSNPMIRTAVSRRLKNFENAWLCNRA